MGAERGLDADRRRVHGAASLRPRHEGRGEKMSDSLPTFRGNASMRPRHDGRGEVNVWTKPNGRPQASMRPRHDGRGEEMRLTHVLDKLGLQ